MDQTSKKILTAWKKLARKCAPWTGLILPAVPPTPKLVQALIGYLGREPSVTDQISRLISA